MPHLPPDGRDGACVICVGTKVERRAARERVATDHAACLDVLVENVTSAIDRHRAGEIDAQAPSAARLQDQTRRHDCSRTADFQSFSVTAERRNLYS
jgi:hypothetical protein